VAKKGERVLRDGSYIKPILTIYNSITTSESTEWRERCLGFLQRHRLKCYIALIEFAEILSNHC
jgi:hypothetical protein